MMYDKKIVDDVVIDIDNGDIEPQPKNLENTTIETAPEEHQEQVKMNNDEEFKQPDLKSLIFQKLGVSNSNNPIICIFHLLFKILAIVTYLFSGFILNSITIFILVSIFAVLDFWIVKNLSGRILAGLRWWRVIDEKGEEKWIFESFDEDKKANNIDLWFFWYGQIIASVFWLFITLVKFLTLNVFWVILSGSTLALLSTNLYAYYKCRKDYQKKLKNVLGNPMGMGGMILGGLRSRMGI